MENDDLCHCGRTAIVNETLGYSRGMCSDCDLNRFDAYPGTCPVTHGRPRIDWKPVMLHNVVVGSIHLDMETGAFWGSLDSEYVKFLNDAFSGGLLEMIVRGIPGNPVSQEELTKQLTDYLERRRKDDN